MTGWVIHWEPGEDTGWHDHGDSVAHIIVVQGIYVEERLDRLVERAEWQVAHIGEGEKHRVIPRESCIAIHVYSPTLTVMNLYDNEGNHIGQQTAEQELEADRHSGIRVLTA